MIAYTRAHIGFYPYLINVYAYNQTVVKTGKKASFNILKNQKVLFDILKKNPNKEISITELSRSTDCDDVSLIFKLLENMSTT